MQVAAREARKEKLKEQALHRRIERVRRRVLRLRPSGGEGRAEVNGELGGRGFIYRPEEISPFFSFSLHRSCRSLKFLVMLTSFLLCSRDFSRDFCTPLAL